MQGPASTRGAKLCGRLAEAWERKVITFLGPVQTVLNEKDKFRDYCQLSVCLPMDSQRKWYIMLSNDWGQFPWNWFGTPLPHAYVHPWVDSKIPITPEISWDGTEPWECHPDSIEEEKLLQELAPQDKAHHGNHFSTILDSNIHSSVQIKYSAHHSYGFPGFCTWHYTGVLKHLEHVASPTVCHNHVQCVIASSVPCKLTFSIQVHNPAYELSGTRG